MRPERELFLVILTMLGLSTIVTANSPEPAIGKAYFLPSIDISGPLRGGRKIFKQFSPSCYLSNDEIRQTVDSRSYFEDSTSFFNSISTSAGVSANLKGKYTMGATLSSKSQSLSEGSTDVKGASVNVWTHVKATYLDTECYRSSKSQLTDELMAHLDLLPSEVMQPERRNSWRQYENFLLTYGSHFVSHIIYGASIKQWTFARKEKSYSQHDLNVRACADFSGDTSEGDLNVKACAGVTKESARSVMHLDMSSKLELRGGSDATRNLLRNKRTEALITQLLNEGRQMETPVSHKFTAIWDILRIKFFSNTRRHAVARNLEQFYEGYLDFGCSLIESGGLQIRRFQKTKFSTKENPEFECILEKAGCHTDDDCHLLHGWMTFAYCYGSSCVEHVPAPFGSKAKGAKIRRKMEGSYYEDVNESCYYAIGVYGSCDQNWAQKEVLWSAATSKFLPSWIIKALDSLKTGK